jgi:hypothetical protein
MFAQLSQGSGTSQGVLQIALGDGTPLPVHASASRDPAGERFLVVLAEAARAVTEPTG